VLGVQGVHRHERVDRDACAPEGELMSSGLDWAREQEQEIYEQEHGTFNRMCQKLLDDLRSRGAGALSVDDIHFLLYPHGTYQYASEHWTDTKYAMLKKIEQKLSKEN